jgi:hypothetical protein
MYDFMTNAFIHHRFTTCLVDTCQCTPAKVACASGTYVQYTGNSGKPRDSTIQVYPWQLAQYSCFPCATVHPPSAMCIKIRYVTGAGRGIIRQPPHKIRSPSSIIPSPNWLSALLYDTYVYYSIHSYTIKQICGVPKKIGTCQWALGVRRPPCTFCPLHVCGERQFLDHKLTGCVPSSSNF